MDTRKAWVSGAGSGTLMMGSHKRCEFPYGYFVWRRVLHPSLGPPEVCTLGQSPSSTISCTTRSILYQSGKRDIMYYRRIEDDVGELMSVGQPLLDLENSNILNKEYLAGSHALIPKAQ